MLRVKRVVFFLLAVVVMMPLMWLPLGAGEPYAYAAWTDFDDVAGHWGGDVMRSAYDAGIIEGYEGRLRPNDPVTGAQLAVMLSRVLAADASAVAPGIRGGEAAGAEIPPGAWYYGEAVGARAMGFLPGAVQFDAPVTRAAAFEAILAAFQIPQARPYTVSLENYSDMFGYGADTRAVMASAVEAGIASGYGGGLRASEDITRAEFLTAMFRAAPLHMDGAVIYGDADIEGTSFASDVWFAADANNISLRDAAGGDAVIRSGRLRSLDLQGVSRFNRFVLASYGADVEIDMAHLTAKTVAIGDGSGAVRISGQAESVEISGDGRSVTVAGGARRVVVSGNG
ncbi:MAG: S-layer homology domain-containing protein, partial [Oscillospiraceae bacterium]|nr:S-layer homology domain-containing protein [Oscillospiraceae bacterium]